MKNADNGEVVQCNYISGQFVGGDTLFSNISPVDGKHISQVVEATVQQVDDAVNAARLALTGSWIELSQMQRCDMLYAIAAGIERRFDDFVDAEMADTGKPLRQAQTIDIPRGAANFRAFADQVKNRGNECFETETHDGIRALNYAVRKPIGVVAVIAPWNLPLLLLTWKVAPALATGNVVVAKPSEETPSTAGLLAEVIDEVGVPAGVFNLVNGFGHGSAGEYLTQHPGVDAITFTGESRTGTAIMRAAADRVKAVSFELGGKNAALIFDDCHFEQAVEGTARSVFSNCGQVCLCTERVYVQRKLFDRFVEALKVKAEMLHIGLPNDAATDMGPLISRQHREKVLSYFESARQEGATLITGGGIPHFGDEQDKGAYIQPTIFTGLPESARLVREEVFGPVCHIAPFDTEEEAISLANDTDYGLAAAVWSGDLERAHRVARRMAVGTAWVNCWNLRDLRVPFGGSGLSGFGREGGVHSLDFYSEPTNICIKC